MGVNYELIFISLDKCQLSRERGQQLQLTIHCLSSRHFHPQAKKPDLPTKLFMSALLSFHFFLLELSHFRQGGRDGETNIGPVFDE